MKSMSIHIEFILNVFTQVKKRLLEVPINSVGRAGVTSTEALSSLQRPPG